MISQKKLDELEKSAKAATPGAWELIQLYGCHIAVQDQKGLPKGIFSITSMEVNKEENAKYVAAANPAMVLEMIAEIKSLRQENARLNAEADWLADRCDEFCGNHNFCGECIMLAGPFKKDKCAGGAKIEYVGQEPKDLDWRAAAREAVSKGDKK